MDLHGTMLWIYVGTVAAYITLAVLGAWLVWRAALRRGFTVYSLDGTWTRVVATKERAEKTALDAALRHKPLVIIDSRGVVIGRLGFD